MKKPIIAIIDYGMGNLYSVWSALEKIGTIAKITSEPRLVKSADSIILPGVGAFRQAMQNLKQLGLTPVILNAIQKGKPFLGICLGLQLLFTTSEEGGYCKGLNVIKGKVKRFRGRIKIPHMGWNQIEIKPRVRLCRELPSPAWMYFAHSFYVKTRNASTIAAVTDYGARFTSMIWKDNVFGTQFHPEKSGKDGLRILRNFIKLRR